MRKAIFVFILFHAYSAFAFNGRVTFLSGKASILPPHHLQASELKLNEGLFLDSSIMTYEKTIVKIAMDDGSILTIGQNSVVHLQQFINPKKKLPGIVSLLQGQIAAVINDQTKIAGYKSKFILKTPYSVIGVRGTEFMVNVDNKKKVSTLITFKGVVTIAKSDNAKNADIDKIGQAFSEGGVNVRAGESAIVHANDQKIISSEKMEAGQLDLLEKRTLAKDEKLAVQMMTEAATETVIEDKKINKNTPNNAGTPPLVAVNKRKTWYAGLGIGIANSSMDTVNINQELNSRGISGQGKVHNSSRAAWKLFIGHDFTKTLATEFSYVHLGKSSTEFYNVAQADAYKLAGLNSISGKGPQLSGRINGHITDDFTVFAKAGVFYWTTSYKDFSQQGNSSNVDLNIYEFTHGYGLELKAPSFVTDRLLEMAFRLDYDFYHMKGNSTHLITAGTTIPFL